MRIHYMGGFKGDFQARHWALSMVNLATYEYEIQTKYNEFGWSATITRRDNG